VTLRKGASAAAGDARGGSLALIRCRRSLTSFAQRLAETDGPDIR
jgi:hypothetical protein